MTKKQVERGKLRLAGAAMAGAMAMAIPASAQQPTAPVLEFAFEEIVTLGESVSPGDTPRGGRNIIPILGGTFSGTGINGQIMPGGWDWQLLRADGCRELVADYFLKTDDGVIINVVNTAPICPPNADGSPNPVRTHPVFEAPIGKYDWLNKTTFIGTLESAPEGQGRAIRIHFYRVR